MKKILLCFLTLIAGAAFAQDTKTIKTDFESIVTYTHQQNMDKVIDMTYPELFKLMPKEQMKATAKGMLNGMGVKTIFEDVPLMLKLSPVKQLTNAAVCMGSYEQSMVMEFKDPAMVNMMVKASSAGSKVEKLAPNKIRMKGTQYLLAIKDSHTNNTWKYLRYDDQDAAANGKILSKEIFAAAGQLKASLKTAK